MLAPLIESIGSFATGIVLALGALIGTAPDPLPAPLPAVSSEPIPQIGAIKPAPLPGDDAPALGAEPDPIRAAIPADTPEPLLATMVIAGGCFWSVESDMEKVPGVISAVAGYSGGTLYDPTYETYKKGGHREVVEVTYDARRVSYAGLVEYALKHTDPTDPSGTFYDRGDGYRAAVYFSTPEEERAANRVITDLSSAGAYERPVIAPIIARERFWPAEAYHQDYARRNPEHYARYRVASGRAAFIERHWGGACRRYLVPA